MKKIILIIVVIYFSSTSFGQIILKSYDPVSEIRPDLSKETEREIKKQNELLLRENLSDLEQKELDDLLIRYGEVIGSVWDIEDGGCSWYCGGGNYKVSSSSELKSQGSNNYSAKSANNLNYKTAWCEGEEGDGIGEYIEYTFGNKSPRITSIIVANGYMKSDLAWKNNNRVKTLKLYVNGKEYGLLNLSDTKTDQEFKVGTLGHNKDGSDLILRFEIIQVYNGEKYNDTAITEIYFDGIDVH